MAGFFLHFKIDTTVPAVPQITGINELEAEELPNRSAVGRGVASMEVGSRERGRILAKVALNMGNLYYDVNLPLGLI